MDVFENDDAAKVFKKIMIGTVSLIVLSGLTFYGFCVYKSINMEKEKPTPIQDISRQTLERIEKSQLLFSKNSEDNFKSTMTRIEKFKNSLEKQNPTSQLKTLTLK